MSKGNNIEKHPQNIKRFSELENIFTTTKNYKYDTRPTMPMEWNGIQCYIYFFCSTAEIFFLSPKLCIYTSKLGYRNHNNTIFL